VLFALATSLRQANVLHLQWSHANLAARHPWVDAVQSKNRRPIAVPLNTTAQEVLRRQIGKHPDRVFTYAGKPLDRANTHAWQKAPRRAGIANFRWHDLRHTWVTWHRQAGTPTHELQRLGSSPLGSDGGAVCPLVARSLGAGGEPDRSAAWRLRFGYAAEGQGAGGGRQRHVIIGGQGRN
jgi:Phage integrase family